MMASSPRARWRGVTPSRGVFAEEGNFSSLSLEDYWNHCRGARFKLCVVFAATSPTRNFKHLRDVFAPPAVSRSRPSLAAGWRAARAAWRRPSTCVGRATPASTRFDVLRLLSRRRALWYRSADFSPGAGGRHAARTAPAPRARAARSRARLDGQRLFRRQRLARVGVTDATPETQSSPSFSSQSTPPHSGHEYGMARRMHALVAMHRQLASSSCTTLSSPVAHDSSLLGVIASCWSSVRSAAAGRCSRRHMSRRSAASRPLGVGGSGRSRCSLALDFPQPTSVVEHATETTPWTRAVREWRLRNNGSIAGRYRARAAARDDQTTLVDREVKSGGRRRCAGFDGPRR